MISLKLNAAGMVLAQGPAVRLDGKLIRKVAGLALVAGGYGVLAAQLWQYVSGA
ncbi:hypothetical protein QS306_11885 [Paraburkholderia bonniea]|uniref:hypothetical protein n=1 Tax=Paraburkholderia bonniea TaxID=2152891 RepID=UPI001292BA34|nr:hypothetical protein [Paraburkholderia bonniea]WJF89794.1 hypothetical protein QS306_11885 [Paraburkholderia bonniea]WJF93108.1 hypothetical protein QS308_11895 [Paraburkholderia bonniea]